MAIEAGFGAASIDEGEAAGAIECARIANQRDELFRLHGIEFFFLEDTGNQFAGFAMAVFHGINQRQSDFAFFQIAEDGFAELLAGSGEVQKIVNELKSKARIAAIFGEGFFVDVAEATQNSAEAGATAKEAGGFVSGELEGVFFGDVHAADFGELQEFAFDHFLGEIDEDIENVEVALF